jgi:hypothetical protein
MPNESAENKEDVSELETALHFLVSLLESKRIEVYRSGSGTAYVLTHPIVEATEAGSDQVVLPDPKLHTELMGRDFRAWLAGLLWGKLNIVLRRAQTDQILEVLDAQAMKTSRAYASDMELIYSIEFDPLVSVLVEYCHSKSRLEMKAEPLWTALNEFARSRGMLDRFHRRFPGGPNAFTGRLRKLIPILQHHGLMVEIKRSNGALVVIKRLDDPSDVSSTSPSADKTTPFNDLPPMDDHQRSLLERARVRQTQGVLK